MSRRTEHSENLKRQIEKTRSTYLMMRERGIEKSAKVLLEFQYKPAEIEAAENLAAYIKKNTKYRVDIRNSNDGDGWCVVGITRPRKLTASTLGRWVHWMCRTGYRFDCLFNGWGAKVADD